MGCRRACTSALMDALGPMLTPRVASAERLCVRWLETRTPLELDLLSHATSIARGIIAEALSARTITPGVTTTDDVAWFIRQRFSNLGLDTWFVPTVDKQSGREACQPDQPFCGKSGVIERGDVLHTDVGITYLRLNTDTQEMAYVLRAGETDAPEGLQKALAVGNRWQDLLTGSFATGRTGDEIFARTDAAAKKEGIVHSTYSHPVGFHGHAAGPSIGMWDNQGPVPVTGAWPLAPNTAYAIEGNVKVNVAEWKGSPVQIAFEQTALLRWHARSYAAGRQTAWHWSGSRSARTSSSARRAQGSGLRAHGGTRAQAQVSRDTGLRGDDPRQSGEHGRRDRTSKRAERPGGHPAEAAVRPGPGAGLWLDVRRRAELGDDHSVHACRGGGLRHRGRARERQRHASMMADEQRRWAEWPATGAADSAKTGH